MPIGFIADNHEGEINVTRMANAPEMQRHSVPKKAETKTLGCGDFRMRGDFGQATPQQSSSATGRMDL